jgi:medium-chain acyl-[acyl-carrier-protein] hydrolase
MAEPYEIRSEWFVVRSYEVDPAERLTVPALCGYMQEAAGIDATRLGAGMRRLWEQGLAWVLHRMRLEVSASVRGGDRVGVATWPRRFGRLVAERDFDVHDAEGQRVAVAASRWAVVDLATRRAVRLPEFIRSLPVGGRALSLDGDDGPLPEVEPAELERRFEVRRSDLDVVNHVNNTRYVGWAVESVPDAVWDSHHPAALEILFQKEARYGESVLARSRRLEDDAGLRFAHELRGPGGSLLVRALTRWEPSR